MSAVPEPHNLDIFMVVSADFDVEALPLEARSLFDYTQARAEFEADVFWARANIDPAIMERMLEAYQTTREQAQCGIVEVILD